MEQTIFELNHQLNSCMGFEEMTEIGLDPNHFPSCHSYSDSTSSSEKEFRRFLVNLYQSPIQSKPVRRSPLVQNLETTLTRSVIFLHEKNKDELVEDMDTNNNNSLCDNDNSENIDYCKSNELTMTQYLALKNDRDFECVKLSQVSKVLRGLYEASKYGFWREKLLSEKILLESGRSVNLMLEKIRENVQYCTTKDIANGKIKISKFKFQLNEAKRKSNETEFFILLLINGTRVYGTKIQRSISNTLFFDDEFTVNLDSSTALKLEIYSITMADKPKFVGFRSIFSFINNRRKLFKTQRVQYKNVHTLDIVEEDIVQTSFKLCAKMDFFPTEYRSKEFILCPATASRVQKTFTMCVKIEEFKIELHRTGFVTLGRLIRDDFLSWNRQWCVLKDHFVLIYSSPGDVGVRQPNFSIDLMRCVRNVEPATRTRCNRSNTLLIDVDEKFFLRFDSCDEMTAWNNDFNVVFKLMRLWKIM